MSGPVSTLDAPGAGAEHGDAAPPCVEVSDSRESRVGRVRVRRALPRRGRRTVGAWCFADHAGPERVTPTEGLDVGPHPHTGLHTVTWLVSGEVLHRDSLGSEQPIRPGQLNLMTAGHGIAHAEEAVRTYTGELHGVQLWVAQPEATRHGAPAFEHHGELPRVELGSSELTVLVGSVAGATSPARADSPLLGVDAVLGRGTTTWPLDPAHEHAVVVVEGAVAIGDHVVRPGQLGYLGQGRDELPLTADERTRLLLLGGEPFPEPVLMVWNFVARTREEVDAARAAWASADERFGETGSHLPRIPAPPVPWAARG